MYLRWFNTGFDLTQGFSTGITDTWDWIILYCEGCLVHCRLFSCIPGLYPLDAIAPPQSWLSKMSPTLPNIRWGKKSPLVENHWFNAWIGTKVPWRKEASRRLLEFQFTEVVQPVVSDVCFRRQTACFTSRPDTSYVVAPGLANMAVTLIPIL